MAAAARNREVVDAATTDPNAADPTKSGDVVMVGCKLPHGLILEIVEPGENRQPKPTGERHVLKGANSMRRDRTKAQGEYPYALTPVPRAFWEAWLAKNKDLEFVKRGFVFAEDSLRDAQASAKEKLPEKTGMEAMQQEKDPRIKDRTRVPDAQEVETDQDALQRALSAST